MSFVAKIISIVCNPGKYHLQSEGLESRSVNFAKTDKCWRNYEEDRLNEF